MNWKIALGVFMFAITPALIVASVPVAIPMLALAMCAGTSSSDIPGGGNLADGKVPAAYEAAVKKAGSICSEVTPALIAAQIEQESGWNPKAGSPAGAQGIAQFMPATWASSGHDHDGDGIADIWNPNDAIPSQGELMCANVATVKKWAAEGKIDLYGKAPIDLALAGYNAGMGAVQSYGGIPPYEETRAYVPGIKDRMKKYLANSGDTATIKMKPRALELRATNTTSQTAPPGNFQAKFVPPIKGQLIVTSYFGYRSITVEGRTVNDFHTGVDLAATGGTPQYATAPGEIILAAATGDGCGIAVKIRHPDYKGNSYDTLHCHLSAVTVKVGQQVKTGDQIGKTGTTGFSTGNHVHYEIRVNGTSINPWPVIKDGKLANTNDADEVNTDTTDTPAICKIFNIAGGSTTDQGTSTRDLEGDRKKIVEYAKTLLDKGYRWGGTGPDYFDCSGFVQYVFKHAIGKDLPRTAAQQGAAGKEITRDEAQAGDLVMYGGGSHISIYLGEGKVIHALSPQQGLQITGDDPASAGVDNPQYIRVL